MCCKWSSIGLAAASFGLGVLLSSLFPATVIVPLSATILVVAGITLIL
jgi:hypothetical protein